MKRIPKLILDFLIAIFVCVLIMKLFYEYKKKTATYPKAKIVCNEKFKYGGAGGTFDGEWYIENTNKRDKVKPFGLNCLLFVEGDK